MRRTEVLEEIRKMRFEETYLGWNESHLTQEDAARVLGVCDRTFRRYVDRYEQGGMEGLSDKRLTQVTHNHFPQCSARAAGKWLWITPADKYV